MLSNFIWCTINIEAFCAFLCFLISVSLIITINSNIEKRRRTNLENKVSNRPKSCLWLSICFCVKTTTIQLGIACPDSGNFPELHIILLFAFFGRHFILDQLFRFILLLTDWSVATCCFSVLSVNYSTCNSTSMMPILTASPSAFFIGVYTLVFLFISIMFPGPNVTFSWLANPIRSASLTRQNLLLFSFLLLIGSLLLHYIFSSKPLSNFLAPFTEEELLNGWYCTSTSNLFLLFSRWHWSKVVSLKRPREIKFTKAKWLPSMDLVLFFFLWNLNLDYDKTIL